MNEWNRLVPKKKGNRIGLHGYLYSFGPKEVRQGDAQGNSCLLEGKHEIFFIAVS